MKETALFAVYRERYIPYTSKRMKHFSFFIFQVTDKNDLQFLNSWHQLNKPHVLLFDQVPAVPLLYKVSSCLAV